MLEETTSVIYEQPLSERVRTFLRLECLFAQARYHRENDNEYGIRAFLHLLLDTLVLLSRSDIKSDIVKELTEQHQRLTRLSATPAIDPARLSAVLAKLSQALTDLHQMSSQMAGAILRDNDFLMSIMHRASIPGGTCGFDLPHLHHWLSRPSERIARELNTWFVEVAPFEQAISLYLQLLRASVAPSEALARGGMYVVVPPGPCQLIRVWLAADVDVYPEISAGKHRCTVRMMQLRDISSNARQLTTDLSFNLQFCSL